MGNRPAANLEARSCTKLTDEEIVARCLENERAAWNEFFRRFLPIIKNAIKKKLYASGHMELCRDPDVIWNIHQDIVIKLFKDGKLRQCTDPSGVKFWLREIAANQTIDWLRQQNRTKNLPEKQTQESMLSLSAPLTGNMDLMLEDTLSDDSYINEDVQEKLEEALSGMKEIKNEQTYWVIRLSIIAHMPFMEEEIRKLAAFTGHRPADIKNRLDSVMTEVDKKIEKKLKASARAVILWYELRRLETRLYDERKVSGITAKADELIAKIQQKTKQRENLLKQGRAVSRPSNQEIAGLIGLTEDKVEQVSVILLRARQALQNINS